MEFNFSPEFITVVIHAVKLIDAHVNGVVWIVYNEISAIIYYLNWL